MSLFEDSLPQSATELINKSKTDIQRELEKVSNENQATLDMYGTKGGDGSFAANCLLARRLAERGVRFVQLYHQGWDHHGDLPKLLPDQCRNTDRASAALVTDLKRRGLLDDTLVIWV